MKTPYIFFFIVIFLHDSSRNSDTFYTRFWTERGAYTPRKKYLTVLYFCPRPTTTTGLPLAIGSSPPSGTSVSSTWLWFSWASPWPTADAWPPLCTCSPEAVVKVAPETVVNESSPAPPDGGSTDVFNFFFLRSLSFVRLAGGCWRGASVPAWMFALPP